MNPGKPFHWLIALALVLAALPAVAVSAPPAPDGSGVESLHDSFVYFDPTAGSDRCPLGNSSQTFCFTAVSNTTDWDYAYYLWMRFPAGWTVDQVTLHGTPTCTNGGTFGDFDWLGIGANQVRIDHVRYHANPTDTCEATYCFQVTSGSTTPGSRFALVSWYWVGSGYGSTPYYPCSADNYTPGGQAACDEAIWPPAAIPACPRVHLPLLFRNH